MRDFICRVGADASKTLTMHVSFFERMDVFQPTMYG